MRANDRTDGEEECWKALRGLEAALLDYVERYGLTPKARAALEAADRLRQGGDCRS